MASLVWALNPEALKFLGRSFPSTLGQGVNNKTSHWMGGDDKKKFDQKTINLFIKDYKKFKKYLSLYQRHKKTLHRVCHQIHSLGFKNISNSQLAKLYQNFEKANAEFMLIGQYIAFNLIEIIPDILEQRLTKAKISREEIKKIVPIVLFPFQTKAVAKMETELTKIAYKFKSKKPSKKIEKQTIKRLVKKYGWLPSMVIDTPLWDEKFFKNWIKDLKQNPHLKKLLENAKTLKKETKSYKKTFNNLLKQYPKLEDIFKIANGLTDLKDKRDEARRFAYFLVRPIFYEIASKAKLKLNDLLLLTSSEIIEFLLKETLPPKKEISQRRESFIICMPKKKFVIYSGKQAIKFSRKYLKEEKGLGQNRFSGIPASLGRVTGKVRIVLDKRDLPRMRQGEIMVAITTHPDYLLAMKRAKAIITDEGGLTSHASIVSRELNIPCIVGTKIATKVLRNGDLVEVDAEKGVVKKLK